MIDLIRTIIHLTPLICNIAWSSFSQSLRFVISMARDQVERRDVMGYVCPRITKQSRCRCRYE